MVLSICNAILCDEKMKRQWLEEKNIHGKKIVSENRVVAAWLSVAIYQISSTDQPRI